MIVLHAGMPKAGSSTIQRWLQDNTEKLREQGVVVTVAGPGGEAGFSVVPYEDGGINSGWVVRSIAQRSTAAEQDAAIEGFVAALGSAAEQHGDIVVSGEFLAHPFWSLHEHALGCLQELSARHEVRVAYYVRPQHTALEAAWREFGWYATGVSPSAFMEQRVAWLRYAATRRGVRALAPGLDFAPRPLREDLLDDGDLIADFAGRFLGIETRGGGERANRGLPLELLVALRAAPAGMFSDDGHRRTEQVDRIKRVIADLDFPEDDRIEMSRRLLWKFAHRTFAAENEELGWGDFVPPPPDDDSIPALEELDSLWTPRASPAELAFLFRVLRRI